MKANNTYIRKKNIHDQKSQIDYGKVQLAKVKSSADPTHNGKLLVWLVNSNTNEDLPVNWISAIYASPFGGSTDPAKVDRQATQSYAGTQKSYGFFAVPPDVNNYVLVTFVNGDETHCYWFACIYKDTLTQMVPGLGQNTSYNATGPVAEMNIFSGQYGNPQVNPTRPLYTPFATNLQTQGLQNDPVRGAGSSSVWRDATPKVYGLLSPGGNQMFIDDGNGTATGPTLIRLRTQSGAQILIDETNGNIYMINKAGSGWVELNNDGNILMYGAGSISLNTDKDFNVNAGGNVNITAANAMNLKAVGADASLESVGANTNMYAGAVLVGIAPTSSFSNSEPPTIASPSIIPTHEPFTRP